MNKKILINIFLRKKITTHFGWQFKHLITLLNRMGEIELDISPQAKIMPLDQKCPSHDLFFFFFQMIKLWFSLLVSTRGINNCISFIQRKENIIKNQRLINRLSSFIFPIYCIYNLHAWAGCIGATALPLLHHFLNNEHGFCRHFMKDFKNYSIHS